MKQTKLIGPAGRLYDRLSRSLNGDDHAVKLLFSGPPGTGKSELAKQLAHQLCGTMFNIESENGRNVSIHAVRKWNESMFTSSLYGNGFKAIIVNEVDTMPKDAQDALLTFLDELPPMRAFIGTSNLDLSDLTERFRTRLQRYEVGPPSDAEIVELLKPRVPESIAQHFAALAGGNVRAATLDAEAWLRTSTATEKKRAASQFDFALSGLAT